MNIYNIEDMFGGKEEYEKWLDEILSMPNPSTATNGPPTWGPSPVWTHGQWIMEDEEIIPFEQDENGVYGYKCLVNTPESEWLISPNRMHNSRWENNQLTAHMPPHFQNQTGIYGTKDLESLQEWYRSYDKIDIRYFGRLVVVRIQVWGIIVEHTKGFRAEHARIERIIHGYR